MKLLILIVLVLGFMVVLRLSRVAGLARDLRGLREERISDQDNKANGMAMWAFGLVYMVLFVWLPIRYKDAFMPVAASTQGELIDLNFTIAWYVLGFVFFLTNIALFYFVGRYYSKPGRKAYWFPYFDRLEIVWTVVPTVALVAMSIFGIHSWGIITGPAKPDAMQVEIYSEQFKWTFRYPGRDGKLGATDYRLITTDNPLGIVTEKTLSKRLADLKEQVAQEKADRDAQEAILPKNILKEKDKHIAHLNRTIERLIGVQKLMEKDIEENGENSLYLAGADDKVTSEFRLPVGEDIELLCRSKDVIHSVYIPHMRAQMNTVPGMTTRLNLNPTITTDSMKTITDNADFEYVLMCNKVCGVSHYNMQSDLIVEDPKKFKVWSLTLPVFERSSPKAEVPAAEQPATGITQAPTTTLAAADINE